MEAPTHRDARVDPLLPSLYALVITYMQERRRSSEQEKLDPAEFQAWIRDEAMPELITAAAENAQVVSALQADSKARLDQITVLLEALSVQVQVLVEQVRRPTPQSEWAALPANDQDILAALVSTAQAAQELEKPVRCKDLAGQVAAPVAVLKVPAKRLAESHLLKMHEYSGEWSVSLKARGLLFTQLALQPQATRSAIGAIARSLRGKNIVTAGHIAQEADAELVLVLAALSQWRENGLLETSELHPPQLTRVLNVKPSLQEATTDEVAVGLLRLV